MCSYSMIADHFNDKWRQQYPGMYQQPNPLQALTVVKTGVSQAEFDVLKKEVADLKELLIKAKKYDADNGEPDCEMAEKVALLKQVAKLVGIDITSALPNDA